METYTWIKVYYDFPIILFYKVVKSSYSSRGIRKQRRSVYNGFSIARQIVVETKLKRSGSMPNSFSVVSWFSICLPWSKETLQVTVSIPLLIAVLLHSKSWNPGEIWEPFRDEVKPQWPFQSNSAKRQAERFGKRGEKHGTAYNCLLSPC